MITIKNEFMTVQLSTLGGELQSIKDSCGREYLWQGDPAYWGRRAPNLFPYTGRTTGGKCTYLGREYPLPKHGFIISREMKVERLSENCCTLLTTSDPGTMELFPFEFAFRIRYSLEGRSLTCRYQVTNLSDVTMYFGLGAHPAFALPTSSLAGYSLRFAPGAHPVEIALSSEGYVLDGRTPYPLKDGILPLDGYPFENSLALTGMSEQVALTDHSGSALFTMEYRNFSNLVLWRWPDAPFFCIEPWCSLPSRQGVVEELTTQPGLVALEEGDFSAWFRVSI